MAALKRVCIVATWRAFVVDIRIGYSRCGSLQETADDFAGWCDCSSSCKIAEQDARAGCSSGSFGFVLDVLDQRSEARKRLGGLAAEAQYEKGHK